MKFQSQLHQNQIIDLAYLYLMVFIIFLSGLLYRTYKISKDINKTKSIIDSAQPYKKYGKITIKISDQCVVPIFNSPYSNPLILLYLFQFFIRQSIQSLQLLMKVNIIAKEIVFGHI